MGNLFFLERQEIPSLLLIHGLGSNHKCWKFQIDYFSKKYRVIAGDSKWHGKSKSTPIPPKYSIKQYAEDWWKIIKEIRPKNLFIMGSGMGSAICLQTALDHPNAVKGMILINSWSHCDDDFHTWLQKWVKVVREEGTDGLAKFVIPHLFSKDFIQENPEIIKFYSQVRAEQKPEAVKVACRACMKFDVREKLEKIRTPTLLIAGEYDVLNPPYKSKFILEKIPHSKYVAISRSGHMPYLEKPSEFNSIVLDFINEVCEHENTAR